MMQGKMHGKKLAEAKMHYEQMMSALDAAGMEFEDLKAEMEGPEDYEEGEESEDMAEEGPKPGPMDKGKVAIIVAKMKNKLKGSAE